jgi:hypothetical protein
MKMTFLALATAVTVAVLPVTAHGQDVMRGDGPGERLGDAVDHAVNAAEAILGVEERPRFREYVIHEHRPSYRVSEQVHVGYMLPEHGVTLYEVPPEYHVRPGYRYAVVNDRAVIVEPRSRRIVEIID